MLATQLVAGLEAGLRQGFAEDAGEHVARNCIRILGGCPSDNDIAALIAVFAAGASPQNVSRSPMSSLGDWGNPTDHLRYGLTSAPAHFVHAHFSR
ncbi:hypothetical protein A3K89_17280 [Rhodococcoides kyotonense]|uniref:Uncharacterized protein n=1 Tax=Rhodococcoides kyotonense TaxID=398843 RepID=A0A177YMH4_9NOCA|nr:hypothetical protein A3K89_17280 [Rhodococcus kyotonensis]